MSFKEGLLLSVLFGCSALTACGGGGGGGSGGSGNSSNEAPSQSTRAATSITSANAVAVSGEVDQVNQVMLSARDLSSAFASGVVVEPSAKHFNVVDFSRKQLERVMAFEPNSVLVATGGVVTSTVNCATSGSVTVTLNDNDDNNEFSNGDTAKIVFNNCAESGATSNGSIRFTSTTVNGTVGGAGGWDVSATVGFVKLRVVEGFITHGINGSMNIAIATTDGNIFTSSISGASLSMSQNSQKSVLTDFAANVTYNNSSLLYNYSSSGTIDSDQLNGSVTFETLTPFQQDKNSDFPTSGVMKVTGANASSLKLTALDVVNVQLETDADGDGTYETSVNKTWTDITGI